MGRMFGFRRVTRNFFRAGECSWNQGTSINIHLQHEIKRPRMEKISGFFRLETLENCILNENFYPQMTTIKAFFPQIRALFSNFRKRARETSPSPSSPFYLRAWVCQDCMQYSKGQFRHFWQILKNFRKCIFSFQGASFY